MDNFSVVFHVYITFVILIHLFKLVRGIIFLFVFKHAVRISFATNLLKRLV